MSSFTTDCQESFHQFNFVVRIIELIAARRDVLVAHPVDRHVERHPEEHRDGAVEVMTVKEHEEILERERKSMRDAILAVFEEHA